MALSDRLRNAWRAFSSENKDYRPVIGPATYGTSRPDRPALPIRNDKSIITAIYNRLAVDVANVPLKHVLVDKLGRMKAELRTGLNECLTVSANIDQGATHFRQDIVSRLLNDGVVAIVPVETYLKANSPNLYDIRTMRAGKILEWYPEHVRVQLYNEKKAQAQELTLPKSQVAIIENPFYNVMNSYNSTLQRLLRKLALMDSVDEQTSSGKLDLIIQLPYVVKSEARKEQADTIAN